jgi:hypothetical protein
MSSERQAADTVLLPDKLPTRGPWQYLKGNGRRKPSKGEIKSTVTN